MEREGNPMTSNNPEGTKQMTKTKHAPTLSEEMVEIYKIMQLCTGNMAVILNLIELPEKSKDLMKKAHQRGHEARKMLWELKRKMDKHTDAHGKTKETV